MTPQRWQQIDELFHAALNYQPAERAAFLVRACGDDESLRLEVESLISSHQEAKSFIERPAGKVAADLLHYQEPAFAPGQQIENYTIIRQLGAGGMGEVYLAQDSQLGRKIAIKILPVKFTLDARRVNRFAFEARAASALNHPNIITIHEIGNLNGTQFMVTEFVEGRTLRELMTAGRVKLGEAIEIATQIGSALEAAHAAGIVHRDIKPENIMLRADGFVKVLDFGLAKLTETGPIDQEAATRVNIKTDPGVVMGTVNYMSPEQARGRDIDARTDLWSLGVTLYEMVSGRVPFEGETPSHVVISILENEPHQLSEASVPTELDRIVTKTLRKEKEERYQTARDLTVDLKSLKKELEVKGRQFGSHRRGVTTAGNPPITKFKSRIVIATSAVVLLLATVAYFLYAARSGDKAISSVAVLPFVNESGDTEVEYLSDGISESLINSLSQLRDLRVIPRTTVFRYKDRNVDPQKIGRELGVRAVLTGKIIQRGDTVFIQADLLDIAGGSQLWGGKYDRKFSEIFQAQDEIAKEIVEKLRGKLSVEREKLLTRHPTENTEAYRLYLQGNYFNSKWTEEGWKKSLNYYHRAIEIDPNYALAFTGLANAYIKLGLFGAMRPKDAYPLAKAAAAKALKLDDSLAEAHAASGVVKELYDWDFEGAKSAIIRALEINPNDDGAHQLYGWYFIHMGRFDEAIVEMKQAVDIDPLSLENLASLANAFFYARRPDQAIEQCRKVLEMDQKYSEAYFFLGQALQQQGKTQEAITAFQKAIELSGGSPEALSALGFTYATAGNRDKARKVIDDLKELSARRYIDPGLIAVIHAGLGEKDEAFRWLEKAYEDRSSWMVHAKAEPCLDPLRSDPRFDNLLKRVGLK